MANLPKIGFHSMTPLELGVLQTSEESDEALRIMADVRAYFQGTSLVFFSLLPLIKISQITLPLVSFKRFVDNAVKAIDEGLVFGISNELQQALVSGLKIDSPDPHDTCAKLIAEQPHTAEKRKNLVAAEKKLQLAREELYNVLA